MSFSKARIQRFNECENDVPAPGTYDPKFNTKVRGSVIEKTDRFHDARSVASAEYDISDCSRCMSHVAASYRTPQLPRRKSTSRSCSKVKPCLLPPPKDRKLKYKSQQQLADLQVECSNKNETIQEHERHIEHMREKMKNLELQLEEAHKKLAEVKEQHKKDIETMATMQQQILNVHDEKHQADMERIRSQFLEDLEEKEREIQAEKAIESNLKTQIQDLESELANERQASKEKINAKAAIEEEMRLTTERYKARLERVETEQAALGEKLAEKDTEIARLSATLEESKTSAETQAKMQQEILTVRDEKHKVDIERIRSQFLELIKEKEHEIQSKKIIENNLIIQIEDLEAELANERQASKEKINAKAAIEEEMRVTIERYKVRLERIETEQAVLDKKLARKDTEIAKLSVTIEELKFSAESQAKIQQEILTVHDEKHQADIERIRSQFLEDLEEKEREIETVKAIESNLKTQFEDLKAQLANEKQASKEKLIAKAAVEEEMRLTAEEYKARLARVEKDGAALYKKLGEKDAEIVGLSAALEEFKSSPEIEDQTELLEQERARREAVEEELRKLIEYNKDLRKDYEEVSEKYAELIGHQNPRQRIKHVSQLKDKINLLEEELHVKTRIIKQQQKALDKLKVEENRTPIKKKENALGVSKNVLSTPMAAPQITSTPLRSRNE